MWCHKAKSIRTPIMSGPSHLKFFSLRWMTPAIVWPSRAALYKGDFQQSAICEMLINLANPLYWKSVAHVKQSMLHVLVSVLHSAWLIRDISNYLEKSQTHASGCVWCILSGHNGYYINFAWKFILRISSEALKSFRPKPLVQHNRLHLVL